MIFLEFDHYRRQAYHSEQHFRAILDEKERIFERTQPNAVRFDREKVTGGSSDNLMDSYLVTMEEKEISDRLQEAREILDDRRVLLELKRRELMKSRELLDRVYVLRWLERTSARKIARKINYSEAQVYRILRNISNLLKNERKCEFFPDKITPSKGGGKDVQQSDV